MKIALTLLLLSLPVFIACFLIDESRRRNGGPSPKKWISVAGLASFSTAVLAGVAALICLIWGIA